MSDYYQIPDGKDPHLWQVASRRASFKRHLASYIIVNSFLWVLWYFTAAKTYGSGLPWPIWSTLGWGIGIAFHFAGAYINTGTNSVEKEYDKLTQNNSKP